MTILQKPADLNLSSNLPEFIISSAAPIDFILKKGGDILLSARYVPGDDSKVIIDIKDIVESSLSCNLRDQEQAYVQDQLSATFAAEINGTSVAFVVVKGGVDRLATSASAFLKSNWLTWQPQTKYVTYYTPEFLTFYAEVATRVMVKAYFTSGDETSEETRELYNSSAGSAYTVPVQYAVISKLFGSRLPSFYDVWFASPSGTRLSYIQRYVAGGTMSETEDWIIFENSLGGLDTFRAYGETELTAEHVHNLAELGDETEEYRVDTKRNFSKSTGWLDNRQRKWLLDFFPSAQKFLYTRNFLRKIVVVEDSTSYVDNVLPTGYSFTYRFADAKPLLNLARVENLPTDLHIEVPELGSFTIPPRLVEFPSQNLSEGLLIPVQNPYSENWATTTISQIFDYTVKGIIQMGPAVFGIVIYDGLDSKAADVCLSANQGRILKETIDNLLKSIKGVALDRLVIGGKEFILNPDGSLSTSDGVLKFNGRIIATEEITAWKKGNEEEEAGSKIIIDSALSTTSENPVQNKVITLVIGNMSQLVTKDKSNLVAAINEAMRGGSMNAEALWQLLGGATTEQINKSHLTDAMKELGTHKHENLDVLKKITQQHYDSWVRVVNNWDTAFYFDGKGNLRVKLNLVGEKEVSAWQVGESGTAPTPGLITIVDNLFSTSPEAALSANQGRILKQMIEDKTIDLTGYATQTWVKSQGYLTQHQSLDGYAKKDGSNATGTWGISIAGYAGSLSGETPQLAASASNNNEIRVVNNENGSITQNRPISKSLTAITKAIDFRWYDTHYQIGALRGDSIDSLGWGVTSSNNNLIFRVNEKGAYVGEKEVYHTGNLEISDNFRKKYDIDLTGLSTDNFYPICFAPSRYELDCEIHSPSVSESDAYNQNHIHFMMTTKGWADTKPRLIILSQGNHTDKEITIGSLGRGLENGGIAVWLRGGMKYVFTCNREPICRRGNYADGNEFYAYGTNLSGGTNRKVSILWQNDDTRSNHTVVVFDKGLKVPGDLTVFGNIIATGEITAYMADGTIGSFLYNPASYADYTSVSTTQAASVKAAKLIKDELERYKTENANLKKAIKTELNKITTSSSITDIRNVLISIGGKL